jgi:serine phosphatase RsbU (regulator of sigma subunit)
VSPVIRAPTWHAPAVPIDQGDRLLLYTDGVSDPIADEEGRAEARLMTTIEQAFDGGVPLLDAIVADVHHALLGEPQSDDVTLLTARVLDSGSTHQ